MAVEIPVVIDIDKAFDDAIKKLPSAMRPLKNTIEQLSQELKIARQLMEEAPIDSKDWQDAANMVKGLSQSLEVASDKMRGLVANDGSIKQMTATLASLNRRWEEMGYMQKFQSASQLSSEAAQYPLLPCHCSVKGLGLPLRPRHSATYRLQLLLVSVILVGTNYRLAYGRRQKAFLLL